MSNAFLIPPPGRCILPPPRGHVSMKPSHISTLTPQLPPQMSLNNLLRLLCSLFPGLPHGLTTNISRLPRPSAVPPLSSPNSQFSFSNYPQQPGLTIRTICFTGTENPNSYKEVCGRRFHSMLAHFEAGERLSHLNLVQKHHRH